MKQDIKKIVASILLITISSISIGLIPVGTVKHAEASCTGAGDAVGAGAGAAAPAAAEATSVVAVPVSDTGTHIVADSINVTMTTLTGDTIETNSAFCWKEFVLDVAFYLLNNVVIEQMTAAIVNWINGGFQGSPQFTLDLQKTLEDVSQMAFAGLVKDISGKTGKDFGLLLCTNFASEVVRGFQVELAVKQSAGKNAQSAYWKKYQKCNIEDSLKSLGGSIESFGQDFRNGGWPAWLKVTQPNNNKYGAYIGVRGELARRLEEAKFIQTTELGWGSGFLSWKKKCGSYATTDKQAPRVNADGTTNYDPTNNPDAGADDTQYDNTGAVVSGPNSASALCNDPKAGQIMTPGKVVEDQLNEHLKGPLKRIEIADEIDEIIGALLGQLMNQVFGEGGLLGASKSSGGQSSYADQLANSTEEASRLKEIAAPRLADKIQIIDAYVKIYTSGAEEIAQTITLLTQLRDCYMQNQSQNAALIAGTNRKITELTTRKQQLTLKATDAQKVIDEYTASDSENNIVIITKYLTSIDGDAYSNPLAATREVEEKTKDLATINTQAQTDLATCQAAQTPPQQP